jgi:hypothetical protein
MRASSSGSLKMSWAKFTDDFGKAHCTARHPERFYRLPESVSIAVIVTVSVISTDCGRPSL